MFSAGGRALARHRGLAFALYLVQLAVSVVVGAVVASALLAPLSRRPLFDEAVAGDAFSLLAVAREHGDLLIGLGWVVVALALLWGALSWFLTGGLLAVLAAPAEVARAPAQRVRTFGAGGAALFGAFARLWAWSLIPYALIAALLLLAAARVSALGLYALSTGELLRAAALYTAPALLLWSIARTALDYARVEITLEPALATRRALLRGLRLVLRSPLPLVHFLLYCALWLGVTAAYVAATWDRPMLGVGGAVGLFALRQASLAARFALHVGLLAGQLHLRRQ